LNVNIVLTKDYEQMDTWSRGKKQSQTNPNKAKSKKAKMNVTSYITTNYENKTPIRAPKKQSQISKRQKTIQPSLPQGIMKKTAISAFGKTNPNKPNQTQFQSQYMLPRMTITPRRGPFAYEADLNGIDKTNCILSTNCVIISKYSRSNKMQLLRNCCSNFNEGAQICTETK